jgi:hypothetical protein
MKRNFKAQQGTTNIKGSMCSNCNHITPLGDARTVRRDKERHNLKCKGMK